MPAMIIIDSNGREVTVAGTAELEAEIGKLRASLYEIIPDLDSEDEARAAHATQIYNKLAERLNFIAGRIPGWNQRVMEERKQSRRERAAELRRMRDNEE